jgi:hypothetical protein
MPSPPLPSALSPFAARPTRFPVIVFDGPWTWIPSPLLPERTFASTTTPVAPGLISTPFAELPASPRPFGVVPM